eukprot:sb/3478128/
MTLLQGSLGTIPGTVDHDPAVDQDPVGDPFLVGDPVLGGDPVLDLDPVTGGPGVGTVDRTAGTGLIGGGATVGLLSPVKEPEHPLSTVQGKKKRTWMETRCSL